MKKILFLILSSLSLTLSAEAHKGALLNAKITLLEANKTGEDARMIQPGTPIFIGATVTNTGDESNAPGSFFVRFAYPAPLANEKNSQLFSTEKIALPPIAPGKEAFVSFSTPQKLPTIQDFVKEDYGMRQYEAIVDINNTEYLIGNANITFSAYYYGGTNMEIEKSVPSIQKNSP